MNKSSRRLVYSSIVIAVTTLGAHANPISGHGNETVTATQTSLRTTESAPLGSDVTESSFSQGERLTVGNSFSNALNRHTDSNTASFGGVAMFTHSSGKVESLEGSAQPSHTATLPTAYADITTTDSVAITRSDSTVDSGTNKGSATESNAGTTPESGDKVVSDASAEVTNAVDSDNLSITTTTAQDTPTSSGTLNSFNPVETSASTPEPSTLVTAGTIFLGFGLFVAARRKRA